MRPRKQLKGDDGMAVKDRISSFPDVLLGDILSFLPTKDVVATSVLSRRWRWAFTSVTCLHFDDSPISHCMGCPHLINSFPSFKLFVNNVLRACQLEKVTTFKLHFGNTKIKCGPFGCKEGCYPEMEPMHVDAWISFPLTKGVRELDLCIRVRKPGKLPSAIFGCKTLEVLKLDMNLELQVPSSLCLPNLIELHLSVLRLPNDDSVNRIVSSCPSLEHLALKGSLKSATPVCISAPSLRRLAIVIYPCDGLPRSKLVLDVPNLEYLMYDDVFAFCYSIGDMNALVEAEVDTACIYTSEEQPENILSLISSLSNSRRLFLMGGCLGVLDNYEAEYKLPIFRNLNFLQLGCFALYLWNKVLLGLLNCAPFLETLVLPEGVVFEVDEDVTILSKVSEEECQSWSTAQVVPTCLGFHLKRISIARYKLTEWELEMVKYFLRNSLALEELMIVCETSVPLADKILLESTLQELPKGSATCSIQVLCSGGG